MSFAHSIRPRAIVAQVIPPLRRLAHRCRHSVLAAVVSAGVTAAFAVWPTIPVYAAPPQVSPWAIVLCKFADVPGDPVVPGLTTNGVSANRPSVVTRSWISTFFTENGEGQGGMFDYWAQVSAGQMSISGTTIFPTTNKTNDDWYQLPLQPGGRGNLSWYNAQPGQARFPIWNDCVTTAASQGASFAGFYGVLVVTNGGHDDSALQNGQGCQAPGASGSVACVVINPFNLYVRDTAHEMGHGLGLLHSRDTFYCGAPQSLGEYCDPYDLMSANAVKSFPGPLGVTSSNGEIAPLGPGLNDPNLDSLGWMPAGRRCTYPQGQVQEFTLAPLETPQDSGCLEVQVPLGPSHYYTVEYRRSRGLDQGLNDRIVLIHEVRPDGRSYLLDSGTLFNVKIHLNPEWTQGQEFWDATNFVVLSVVETAEHAVIDVRPARTIPPNPPNGGRFGLNGISSNGVPGFINYAWDDSGSVDHFQILVSGVFTNAVSGALTDMGEQIVTVPGTQRTFDFVDETITQSTSWTFQVRACAAGPLCSGWTPPLTLVEPSGGGGGGGGGRGGSGGKGCIWCPIQ